MPSDHVAGRLKRLRHRSLYRGFREADLIFRRFAERHLDDLTPEELDQYEALLDEADQDIYGWVMGRSHPPAHHDNGVLARLKRYEPEQ